MSKAVRAKRIALQKANMSRTPLPGQAPARAPRGRNMVTNQTLVDLLTVKGAKDFHSKGRKKTRMGSWINDAVGIDQLGR